MATHSASVTINAPISQVYHLFTHFNDFPKYMTFIKEVTYMDDQTSHWVADIVGRHEWDAVNENWVENSMVGWRSIDGLDNTGGVAFDKLGENETRVTATINYDPPAGFIGDIGESLGAGSHFEARLQHDLHHFAEMVNQAPPGAIDPLSSTYLFHEDSAAAHGDITDEQERSYTRADYVVDDPQLVASAPPGINQAFPTDSKDNRARMDQNQQFTEIEDDGA